ncbi:MAG: MFS transporter, partial [Candidatus Dormibacteria bacterium]
FFAFFFLGSLFMQRVLHYSPLRIGLAFAPDTIAMAALSIGLAARVIVRFGPRRVVLSGLTFIAVGMLLFTRSPENAGYVSDLLLPMILLGTGAGLAFTSLMLVAMEGSTPSDAGLASGVLNTTTQVGGALGLAILATVSSGRSSQLMAQGAGEADALSGGYHLAWAISSGLVLLTIGVAAVVLKPGSAPVAATAAEGADGERDHLIA